LVWAFGEKVGSSGPSSQENLMIHINLLPVKATRKQEASRQQLVLFVVVLVLALGGNYWGYAQRAGVEDTMKKRVQSTQADIALLDKVIGEVKDITQRKEDLKKKMDILNNLKKNRSGPVKVLDAVQDAVPKKVWLNDFGSSGNSMSFSGKALSHDDLAEFMRDLQNVVNTPGGIGRVVEGGESSKESRVELEDGSVKDYNVSDITHFFTGIQLQHDSEEDQAGVKIVSFQLSCTANFAA
jgi:type IV pilus assembly protein PilN